MTSQLVILKAFFPHPHDPKSEKKSGKSTNKKILASQHINFSALK